MHILYIVGIIIAIILLVTLIVYLCIKNKSGNSNDPWTIENLQKNFYKKTKVDKIHIPIFYINLDRSEDRRKEMEKQLNIISSTYERVSAIDGKKITNKSADNVDGISFVNEYPKLTLREIACTLSHIKAIRKAYDRGYKEVLIIEDDLLFYLHPFWKKSIYDIQQNAPYDWSIIQLYTIDEKCNSNNEKFLKYDDKKRCWSAAIYLINRRGMYDILKRSYYLTGDEINITNNIKNSHGVADSYVYDSTNTYIYTKPIFLVGDEFLPSTIHRDHESIHINSVQKKLNVYKKLFPNFRNVKNSIVIGTEGKGEWGEKVIRYILEKAHPNQNIIFSNENTCDFIIKGPFKYEKLWNSDPKKYIYWSGEPYSKNFTDNLLENSNLHTKTLGVFTSKEEKINTKSMWIPYVLYSNWLYEKRKFKDDMYSRKLLVAYCNSNCVPIREKIFSMFVDTAGSKLCHAYGKCNGNRKEAIADKNPKRDHNSEKLIENYSKYRFVIAMENTVQKGYITEKILNAFYSGAIPIYLGAPEISELFNPKAFINVENFKSLQDCVNYVSNMSLEKCAQMQKEPIYNYYNDIINLLNTERNLKIGNQVLDNYIKTIKEFTITN